MSRSRRRRMRRTIAPEPDGYRTENYRAPVPATLAGARVLDDRGGRDDLARQERRFHRRAAACAEAAKSSRRHGLARQAAAQHPRQHLAARHRLRKAGGSDRRLSEARPCPRLRRQQRGAAGDLLPDRLLDVVERGQTSAVIRLSPMWPGIRKAPMAGSAPTCRSRNCSRSRGREGALSRPGATSAIRSSYAIRSGCRNSRAVRAIPSPAGSRGRARTAAGRSRSAPRRRI